VRSPTLPAALAAVLAASGTLLRWRGSDTANYLFRADLFRRAGFTVWSTAWYGGLHTPAYSVLLPPLAARLGPAALAGASAVLAALCFDRLLRSYPGTTSGRALAASLLFAAGTVTNLAVGRLAFALGLALGLAALLAGRRAHWSMAAVLSVSTALASPVAGSFLALSWTAAAVAGSAPRRSGMAALAAVSIAPVVGLAALFPEGGTFPFRWPALLTVLVTCGLTIFLVPVTAKEVRAGAVLYAIASIGAFLVPNPIGANIARLGMYVIAPVLVALADRRRALAVIVPALLWWQWSPALDGILRSAADPSAYPAYFQPLLAYLDQRTRPIGRIEIPFTSRHFEAAYIAPNVPLARGWERQVDSKVNALFYARTLDARAYYRWLLDTGVELVALPDAALDPSAENEAALLRADPAFLRPLWSSAHWRVWAVVSSPGLVSGPARLVRQTADTVELEAVSAGEVVIRVRWTRYWSIDGPACVMSSPDGWVHAEVRAAGPLLLHPVLVGARARCAA
jgi:hypothetical protein